MKYLCALLALLLASPALANDCDVMPTTRSAVGSYVLFRVKVADGMTTNTTSTKCTMEALNRKVPYDFYRMWGEEGTTCTSWTALVRDYPVNADTTQCRGTCDPVDLQTLIKGGITSKMFYEPLGEAFDVVTSNVNCSGGLNIYIDFYYRNFGG